MTNACTSCRQGIHRKGRGGKITSETALYQANSCIAEVALALRGECEAIISGDSDFALYVGPGGPDKLGDLMRRNEKFDHKKRP